MLHCHIFLTNSCYHYYYSCMKKSRVIEILERTEEKNYEEYAFVQFGNRHVL